MDQVSSSTFLGKKISGLRNDLGKAALIAGALAAPTLATQNADAIEPLQAPQTLPFSDPTVNEGASTVMRSGSNIKVLYTSQRTDGAGQNDIWGVESTDGLQ